MSLDFLLPVNFNHDCKENPMKRTDQEGHNHVGFAARDQATRQTPDRGVFRYLVDRAAFIDRVELNVWGTRKLQPPTSVSTGKPFRIARPKSIYGWAVNGVCGEMANPFQLRFGVLRHFKTVPPFRLVMHSQKMPVSWAQVERVLRSLLRSGFRAEVSRAEFTFDLSQVGVDYFVAHFQSPARTARVMRDQQQRTTLYVGRPQSAWQARVYEKTATVLRFELVLRRSFLRRMRIRLPHELLALRNLDLSHLVQLTKLDLSKLPALDEREPDCARQRTFHKWARNLSIQDFEAAVRRSGERIPGLFKRDSLHARIRRMQQRLFW
jgi:hypothetical protein